VLAPEKALMLVDLAKSIEQAYCAAKPSYYNGDCALGRELINRDW